LAVPPSPLTIAQIVARNIVPLAGILFLGWSAEIALLLYLLDTLLAIAVILAALMSAFTAAEDGRAARINGEVGAVAMALAVTAFIAIPIGVPVVFVLGPSGFDWRAALADPALRTGALMQAIAALWSYADLWRALRNRSPDELRLKRRFALVFLRWMAVLMLIYSGIGVYSALLVVATYVGVSIFAEVAPDRFLRAMPGGAEDADPEPGTAPPVDAAAPMRSAAITKAIERCRRRPDGGK
jgi:hypothetical protein